MMKRLVRFISENLAFCDEKGYKNTPIRGRQTNRTSTACLDLHFHVGRGIIDLPRPLVDVVHLQDRRSSWREHDGLIFVLICRPIPNLLLGSLLLSFQLLCNSTPVSQHLPLSSSTDTVDPLGYRLVVFPLMGSQIHLLSWISKLYIGYPRMSIGF